MIHVPCIVWLDQLADGSFALRDEWVGSSKSGEQVVASRFLSGHIGELVDMMKADRVFRRSIIAHPTAVATLRTMLGLPPKQVWHTCMLALLHEKGEQERHKVCRLTMWSYDDFRATTGVDKVNNFEAHMSDWLDSFLRDFGPRQ